MFWKQFLPALLCLVIGAQDTFVNGVPLSGAISPFSRVPKGEKIVVRNNRSPDEVGAIEGKDGSGNMGAFKGHSVYKRAAIRDESRRWTFATIPYEFDGSYTRNDKRLVREAMDEWERHTCVRFRPVVEYLDRNRVQFVYATGPICSSKVGMTGGRQTIKLGKKCRINHAILHEIGHALGFVHTHQRPDRDEYVEVDSNGRRVADMGMRYDLYHYGVNYDLDSVMNYPNTSGVYPLDPEQRQDYRNHVSFGDIEMMNKMYKCKPTYCRLMDHDCPGTSFVDQKCKCACKGPNPENPVEPCNNFQAPNQPHTERPYIWGRKASSDYGGDGDSEWSDW